MVESSASSTYSILVVGPAGVGKSTLLNTIYGEEVFRIDYSTRRLIQATGTWLGRGDLPIKLIDTPGMGNPDLPLDELCEDIDDMLHGESIDQVMVVIKAIDYPRKDIKYIMTIDIISEFVNMLKKKNTILVLTHCDQVMPEKRYI